MFLCTAAWVSRGIIVLRPTLYGFQDFLVWWTVEGASDDDFLELGAGSCRTKCAAKCRPAASEVSFDYGYNLCAFAIFELPTRYKRSSQMDGDRSRISEFRHSGLHRSKDDCNVSGARNAKAGLSWKLTTARVARRRRKSLTERFQT
jgi:hypothetical protein